MSTQDEEKLLDAGDLNHRIVAILVANKVKISAGTTLIHDITSLIKSQSESIKEQAEREALAKIDEKVTEVLGYYSEDVFTPPTDDDRDKFNSLNPNAHTRIHCGGIRHGLHQLRRAMRGLSPRDDLEVIHVPALHSNNNSLEEK